MKLLLINVLHVFLFFIGFGFSIALIVNIATEPSFATIAISSLVILVAAFVYWKTWCIARQSYEGETPSLFSANSKSRKFIGFVILALAAYKLITVVSSS